MSMLPASNAPQPSATSLAETPPQAPPWQDLPGARALLKLLGTRLISIRTLSWPLRIATVLTLAMIVLLGGALALSGVDGSPFDKVSWLNVLMIVPPLALAWILLLIGALHGPWYGRFLALGIYAVLVARENSPSLLALPFLPTVDVSGPRPWQWVALAALALWAIVLTAYHAVARLRHVAPPPRTVPLLGATAGIVSVAVLAHYLLLLAPFLTYPQPAVAQEYALAVLGGSLGLLFLLGIPAFFAAGTHIADIGQQAGMQLTAIAARGRANWPVVALAALLAAAATAFQAGQLVVGGHLSPLHAGLVMLALGLGGALLGALGVGLLGRLGRIARWPASAAPRPLVIVLVMLAGAVASLPLLIAIGLTVSGAAQEGRLSIDSDTAAQLNGYVLEVFLLLIGLVLFLWGRRRGRGSAVTGLFLVLGGIFWIAEGMVTQLIAGFQSDAQAHQALFNSELVSIELLVAPATLVVLLWLALRRRLGASSAGLVRALLALNVAALAVAVTLAFFSGDLQPNGGVRQGLIFILSFLWGLLLSGGQLNERPGARPARQVRVLLYLGYTLLVSALVALLTSGGPAVAQLSLLFSQQVWGTLGLVFLGAPYLLTLFVIGVWRWRGRASAPAPGA